MKVNLTSMLEKILHVDAQSVIRALVTRLFGVLFYSPDQKKNYFFSANEQSGFEPHKTEQHSLNANLSANDVRFETFNGKPYTIVPSTMLMNTVVNRNRVQTNQLHPDSWNGVPVTVNHPKNASGVFVSANSPQILETYQIGTVFNARIDGDKLKAEVWIDNEKADKINKKIISNIKSGVDLEVSTGYFSQKIQESGVFEGMEFDNIEVNILPDHFAILPDSKGACSLEQGCGIRANNLFDFKTTKDSTLNFLQNFIDFTKNESPKTKENSPMTDSTETKPDCSCSQISANDQEAIDFARAFRDEQRKIFADKIVANSEMTEESLAGFSINQLQTLANGFVKKIEEVTETKTESKQVEQPKPDFSGRGPVIETNSNEDEKTKYSSMYQNSTLTALKSGDSK